MSSIRNLLLPFVLIVGAFSDSIACGQDCTILWPTDANGVPLVSGCSEDFTPWPGGIVPYVLDFDDPELAVRVRSAMDRIEEVSDVEFIDSTDAPPPNHLVIMDDHPNCGGESFIGRQGGPQPLHLSHCSSHGVIIHELLHALGYPHEHQRCDRDEYVEINLLQVPNPFNWPDFLEYSIPELESTFPYDFMSILHYEECAWGSPCCPDDPDCLVIEVLPPNDFLQPVIGQRDKMSVRDVAKLQFKYFGADVISPDAVWITSLSPGDIIGCTDLQVQVQASDNVFVDRVELFANGVSVATQPGQYSLSILSPLSNAPFLLDWTPSGIVGPVELRARAFDLEDNWTDETIVVIIDPGLDDTQDPSIEILSPDFDGAQVSGVVPISMSAFDNCSLSSIEVYADGSFIGSPDDLATPVVQWNSSANEGLTVLEALAHDAAGNEASAYRIVDVVNDQGHVTLVALPVVLPVDGHSSFALTAHVLDSAGQPIVGEPVTFSKSVATLGVWVDAFGLALPGPPNEPTDGLGRSRAYFRPTTVQTCTFTAATSDDSDSATTLAVEPSGISISLGVVPDAIGPGYSEYRIEAVFSTGAGPIDSGTAEFTTTNGAFQSGNGSGTPTTQVSISTFGEASATLRIFQTADTTLCAEYVEGGDILCEVRHLAVGVAPTIDPGTIVAGPEVGDITMIAGAGDRLAAFIVSKGLVIWDAYSFDRICYWDLDDFDNAINDWDNSNALAVPAGAQGAALAGDNDSGAFFASDCSFLIIDEVVCGPDQGIAVAPAADTGVGIQRGAGNFGGDALRAYDASLTCLGFVANTHLLPDGTTFYGLAYSPAGDRVAGTYRDGDSADGYLVIANAPSFTHRATVPLHEGSRPGGIGWSPSGDRLAVADGAGQIHVISKSGAPIDTFPLPAGTRVGGIAWSPDGNHIAVYIEEHGLAVLDADTGFEIVRCNAGPNDARDTETVAWRSDGRVLFAAWGTPEVAIFAPFDQFDPTIDIEQPSNGANIATPQVEVVGTITDDTGIRPDGARWRIDEGEWTELPISADESFSFIATLNLGVHIIDVEATDLAGRTTLERVIVEHDLPPAILVTHDDSPITNGDPTEIEFDCAREGGPGAIELFVVRNIGGQQLDVGPVLVPEGFMLTDPLEGPLAANESDTFVIQRVSAEAGEASGLISIASNDGDDDPFEIAMGGVVACASDLTCDLHIGFDDVVLVLSNWHDLCPGTGCAADVNRDGIVNFGDLILILSSWGDCP